MEIIDGLIFVKLKNTATVEAPTDARARARARMRAYLPVSGRIEK